MKLKKQLQVLVIGEWDFAGCGHFLGEAINKHTDCRARSIRYHPSTLGFPYDILAPSNAEFIDLWKRADVVHIHDDYRPLPPDLQSKPTVVTYHGSLYRADPKSYNDKAKAAGWIQTAATLDLALLGPRWLPDTRPDLSQYVNKSPAFKACHAPTKRKVKGTAEVVQACRKLVDLDLIENSQWNEALTRKGQCWVTVDQFQLGYGCNAIEAWMMGQPVIGGASNKSVLNEISKLAGYSPLIVSDGSVANIRDQLGRLKNDGAFYAKFAKLGSDYASRFHSMQVVAGLAIEYYHEAIEAFYSRGANYTRQQDIHISTGKSKRDRSEKTRIAIPTKDEKMVNVEYLGNSAGWITFDLGSNKYKFSFAHPVQSVHVGDLAALLAIRDVPRRERGKRVKRPGQFLFRRV